jgi:hypothetical protein
MKRMDYCVDKFDFLSSREVCVCCFFVAVSRNELPCVSICVCNAVDLHIAVALHARAGAMLFLCRCLHVGVGVQRVIACMQHRSSGLV